ncbi:hypothetical protein RRG08_036969 [Elysia crispata]|uniref:Organic solute transporter subunit alpha-like n=1 Tax=Elysia crispata TaxID=231223 RepID=A0AAE0XTV2_9GAST|nr:hypothetical protein RRG08_036969 [Elysia crispata]
MARLPNATGLSDNISSSAACIDGEILLSHQLFKHTNLVEKIFMCVCVLTTVFTVVDLIGNVLFVLRRYKTGLGIKYRTCQILGIYPVVSFSSLFALFFPRAELLCELVATTYISRAMFHFVSLMTFYFGGKKKLLHRLKDDKMNLRSPPCCCCCCLPKIKVTERRFTILKTLVLQAAIVLPLLSMAAVVLWLDGKYKSGELSTMDAFPYLTVPSIVSMLLSLYAYILLYRLCRTYLVPLSISVKFFSLQMVIALIRLQSIVMDILASNGIPACRGALSTVALSQTYKQILIILEVFLLSLLARKAYRDPHDQVAKVIAMTTEAEVMKSDPEQAAAEVGTKNGIAEAHPLSKQEATDDRYDSGIFKDLSWLTVIDQCRESKL